MLHWWGGMFWIMSSFLLHTPFQNCKGFFRCCLANSNLVFLLHLVVNPLYSLWWSLLLIVDFDTYTYLLESVLDLANCCEGVVKPRNLNQKRTQTRPKAVGTICPSDMAGREIWNIWSLCGKQRQVYHLIFLSLLVCLTQTLHIVNKY